MFSAAPAGLAPRTHSTAHLGLLPHPDARPPRSSLKAAPQLPQIQAHGSMGSRGLVSSCKAVSAAAGSALSQLSNGLGPMLVPAALVATTGIIGVLALLDAWRKVGLGTRGDVATGRHAHVLSTNGAPACVWRSPCTCTHTQLALRPS